MWVFKVADCPEFFPTNLTFMISKHPIDFKVSRVLRGFGGALSTV